ncbi:MAG: endonuclease III [Gemmatimonadetes bacterium]|nr:endonuclease III [Gemmatimonadota bacterium]
MRKLSSKRPAAAARPRRARLTGAARASHAREIERRLVALYPEAHCELDFRSPFELLCATILSAQCTDKRVNLVTPELFRRWPDARVLAAASPTAVEGVIKSTGFFRSKAKSLIGMAQALVASHDGQVPPAMEALTALPGVGRKTANVLLGNAFNQNEGIVVDTHVARLAARFGLTAETDPVRIERALMPLFDREGWARLSHLLIWHGRRVCDARKPRCGECTLADICPSAAS